MIDARECEAMARQCEEQAAEAAAEASRCFAAGSRGKGYRWNEAQRALNDAAEAFHRAANEIDGVSGEGGP